MTNDEIITFLKVHLQSIQDNDTQTYNKTTAEDLTLYEWWITPHRIDGLPFHKFMMSSNAERGTVFGAEAKPNRRRDSICPICTSKIMARQRLQAIHCSSALPRQRV
jgi:hypothetical protein